MGFSFDEPEPALNPTFSSTPRNIPRDVPRDIPSAKPSFTADFAVVTTEATGDLAAIHHRTPVMLNTEQAKRWLYTEDPAELEAMMAPDAVMKVRLTEVGEAVNSSRNDGPECTQPITRSN